MGTLLTVVTLAVLLFGLAVYVRNVVHDAAVEGAFHAALADTTLAEGAERARAYRRCGTYRGTNTANAAAPTSPMVPTTPVAIDSDATAVMADTSNGDAAPPASVSRRQCDRPAEVTALRVLSTATSPRTPSQVRGLRRTWGLSAHLPRPGRPHDDGPSQMLSFR